MNHEAKTSVSLQSRVGDYLSQYSNKPNSFVSAAEAAEAEADVNEYLLARAEEELQEAQSRVEEIKRKIIELRAGR